MTIVIQKAVAAIASAFVLALGLLVVQVQPGFAQT